MDTEKPVGPSSPTLVEAHLALTDKSIQRGAKLQIAQFQRKCRHLFLEGTPGPLLCYYCTLRYTSWLLQQDAIVLD
jgi:hypothetical protein